MAIFLIQKPDSSSRLLSNDTRLLTIAGLKQDPSNGHDADQHFQEPAVFDSSICRLQQVQTTHDVSHMYSSVQAPDNLDKQHVSNGKACLVNSIMTMHATS